MQGKLRGNLDLEATNLGPHADSSPAWVFLIVHSLGHPMERTKPKQLRFGDMGFFPAPSLRKWSLEQELKYKWLGSRSQVLDSIRQGRRNPMKN